MQPRSKLILNCAKPQRMKLFSIFIIFIFLLEAFAEASSVDNNAANNSLGSMDIKGNAAVALYKANHLPKINCNQACSRRCKKASKKKRCKRACKACCVRCHCVPPGTYGHKNACPCYARLRTHGNKLKCP